METRFFRSISRKLAFQYSVIFLTGTLLLYFLTFAGLYTSLKNDSSRTLKSNIMGIWAVYQSGGLERVREIMAESLFIDETQALFVRICTQEGKSLLFSYPRTWDPHLVRSLEGEAPPEPGKIFDIRDDKNKVTLEALGLSIGDGLLLQVGISTFERQHYLDLFKRNFLLILILVIFFTIPASLIMTTQALRPIRRLNETIKRIIQTSRLNERIPMENRNDDLGLLTEHFNRMLDKINHLVEGMKYTVDTIAHDIRTPMTRLMGTTEIMLTNSREPEDRESMENIRIQVQEILHLLNSIMDVSQAESGTMSLNLTNTDLNKTCRNIIDLYSMSMEDRNQTSSLIGPECLVSADQVRLKQVLANILDNAVKYAPDNSLISFEIVREPTGKTRLMIKDEGPGIEPEDLNLIWNKLFRGRSSKGTEGLGLGLSLVKPVLEAMDARIHIQNRNDKKGLIVTITFSQNMTKL